MIITTEEGTDSIKRLREELTAGTERNIECKSLKGNESGQISIKDIDGLVSRQDILEAVIKETGSRATDIRVGELRPFYGGNYAVTVGLNKEKAAGLATKGRIRIGLNLCRVSLRVEITQCYRCWGYGHRMTQCREDTDYSDACRKCGKKDHKAATCANEAFCMSCRRSGHATGGGTCPRFRDALFKARDARKTDI